MNIHDYRGLTKKNELQIPPFREKSQIQNSTLLPIDHPPVPANFIGEEWVLLHLLLFLSWKLLFLETQEIPETKLASASGPHENANS